MASPHFEVLVGVVDGFNKDFFTSLPYAPGSFAGFTNGQLARRDNSDGWTETNPSIGLVSWTTAPEVGDVVQGFYVDTLAGSAAEQVFNLRGRIKPQVRLLARVSHGSSIRGVVKKVATLRGTIRTEVGG